MDTTASPMSGIALSPTGESTEVLQQKDQQIDALCAELRAAQRTLAELKSRKSAPPPITAAAVIPFPLTVDDGLQKALDGQVYANQQLVASNKSIQRRLKSLEGELLGSRRATEGEHTLNVDLTDVVQRAGQAMLHRDTEVRALKIKLAEKDNEAKNLRKDRVEARRAVLEELKFSKEREYNIGVLRHENDQLLQLVNNLQQQIKVYEQENSGLSIVPLPPKVTYAKPLITSPALDSLRKQNLRLEELYASSLHLLQQQMRAQTIQVVSAVEKPMHAV